MRVTFKIEGRDEPIVMEDATVPLPNTTAVIDGVEYDVLSVVFAYFTESNGVQQATVRLRPVRPPVKQAFVPPEKFR